MLKTNILAGIIAGAGGGVPAVITVNADGTGDSNTSGVASSPPSISYFDLALPLLTQSGYSYTWTKDSTAGISTLTLSQNYATRAGANYNASADINFLSYLAGTNTTGTADDTATEKYGLIKSYLWQALDSGYNRMLIMTYMARGDGANGIDSTWASIIAPMNQLIRTYWDSDLGCDGMADFAANTICCTGEAVKDGLGTYFNATDKLHLLNGGYNVLTPIYVAVANSIIANKPAPVGVPCLNPYDRQGSTVLSNNNRTVTVGAGNVSGNVASPNLRKNGKWYWEVDCVAFGASQVHFGIGNRQTSYAGFIGALGNNSCALSFDGNVRINANVVLAAGLAISAGDTVRVAFDADTRKIWFSRRRAGVSTSWNNNGSDPASGTGGIDLTLLGTGPLRPIIAVRTTTDTLMTRYAASEFLDSPPTGFSAIGGATGVTAPVVTQAPIISGSSAIGGVITISTPSTATGSPIPNVMYQVRKNGVIEYAGYTTRYTYTILDTTTVSGDVWDVIATFQNVAGIVTSTSNTLITP